MMVELSLKVTGLKPGKHGVHLHAVGKCEPDFTAAGGHFDPGPASNTDPDANHPFHMGDVPNLVVGADGKGAMKVTTTRVTLVGRTAVGLRRGRHRDHHPRQRRQGDDRRAEVRRERRAARRLRRAGEEVALTGTILASPSTAPARRSQAAAPAIGAPQPRQTPHRVSGSRPQPGVRASRQQSRAPAPAARPQPLPPSDARPAAPAD